MLDIYNNLFKTGFGLVNLGNNRFVLLNER